MVAAQHPKIVRAGEPRSLGPFEISGELGQGGSGTVYAVKRDGRALALKVLREDLALSERERRRFLEEAESMRRVEHPAIVPLVDSGVFDDGRPYLAMPLLEGETLGARLSRGRLDLATALRFFGPLADAVETVHRAGLIHRDIKPENVILCAAADGKEERPVLLDLGIARDADASPSTTTEQGGIRGTRAYMAPERFFGAPASVATDVYELGVLLYMMLVGDSPWGAAAEGAASRLHPREPSEIGVVLPEALETVLLRSLSTRPEVRPATAIAFADAVREAGGDMSVASSPTVSEVAAASPPVTEIVAVVEKDPRLELRWRRPFALGVVAVALVVGGGAVALRPRPENGVQPVVAAVTPPIESASTAASVSAAPTASASVSEPMAAHSSSATQPRRSAPTPKNVVTAPRAEVAPTPSPPASTPAPTVSSAATAGPASAAPASTDRLYMDRK